MKLPLPVLSALSVVLATTPVAFAASNQTTSSTASFDRTIPVESSLAKDEIVAVNAYSTNGYKRNKDADGRFKKETYAFGEGGHISGRASDSSIDGLSFSQIARTIAHPLADQQYVPATAAGDTDLLIMVYWGTTAAWGTGTNENASQTWAGSQIALSRVTENRMMQRGTLAENQRSVTTVRNESSLLSFYRNQVESALIMIDQDNRARERQNDNIARLIGYSDELHSTDGLKQVAGLGPYRDDLLSDIQDDRYFVILVACDFRTAWKEKKMKPLWSTRYNVRVRGNNFDQALLSMTQYASRYFGQDTKGLVRKRIPLGKVEIGRATVLPDKPSE